MAFIMFTFSCRTFRKACNLLGLQMAHRLELPPIYHRKLCSLAENINERVTLKDMEQKIPLVTPIANEYSYDSLLSTLDANNFTVQNAIVLLKALSGLTTKGLVQPSDYAGDRRFTLLCEQLQAHISRLNHVNVVDVLKNLFVMGINPETRVVQFFENELLWRMRKMNFKTLSICLHIHYQHVETEMQKRVFAELVKSLKARWIEIDNADDVLKNLEKASLFDEEFISRIEDRALLVTEKMTLEELHKLFIALANSKRRPMPLLRSITYYFTRSTEKLNVKQTINVLHSLNILNFSDSGIMEKLSSDILPEISTMKGNSMFSLLTTLGQLRWRYPALLDACCEWIVNNSGSCRIQELVACVLTLAALNYKPEEDDILFAAVLSRLNRGVVNADAVWLDVVLSLAILGRATAEHLLSVLDPSFFNKICGPSASQDAQHLCKLKFLTVGAVAKFEVPVDRSKKDERLCDDIIVQIPQSSLMLQCHESVISSLANFLPPGKFMATNLNTSLGVLIDAEFIIDKEGKPVPLAPYGIRAGNGGDLKSLPKGCNRVALLIWHFKDFTQNTSSLTGKNALTVRMLNKIGYQVVEIPYTDFQDHKTVVKKVQYLQRMINEKLRDVEELKRES